MQVLTVLCFYARQPDDWTFRYDRLGLSSFFRVRNILASFLLIIVIQNFWNVLNDFDMTNKKKFLGFVHFNFSTLVNGDCIHFP